MKVFSAKLGGVASFGGDTSEQIFSTKIICPTNLQKVFSLESFPLYGSLELAAIARDSGFNFRQLLPLHFISHNINLCFLIAKPSTLTWTLQGLYVFRFIGRELKSVMSSSAPKTAFSSFISEQEL